MVIAWRCTTKYSWWKIVCVVSCLYRAVCLSNFVLAMFLVYFLSAGHYRSEVCAHLLLLYLRSVAADVRPLIRSRFVTFSQLIQWTAEHCNWLHYCDAVGWVTGRTSGLYKLLGLTVVSTGCNWDTTGQSRNGRMNEDFCWHRQRRETFSLNKCTKDAIWETERRPQNLPLLWLLLLFGVVQLPCFPWRSFAPGHPRVPWSTDRIWGYMIFTGCKLIFGIKNILQGSYVTSKCSNLLLKNSGPLNVHETGFPV